MSVTFSRKDKLRDSLEHAEDHLVLRQFQEAEKISLDLLHTASYLPNSVEEQRRAAFVFVQALFEQGR
jgi:hypothetical protein